MSKPYIYITRKLPEEVIAPLFEIADVGMWEKEEDPVPRDILKKEASRATALYTMLTEDIDKELFDLAENLKVVANLAVGYDNIDIDYATKKGVYVCNTPDVLSDTTADLVFALLMATARRVTEGAEYIKQGKWKHWSPLLMVGHDIHHKTIGIVGMGRIGEKVALRATGFEMDILYHNRRRNIEVEEGIGASFTSFDELLSTSDFIVCMAPLTSETENMFDNRAFQLMKSSAIFINAARGGVVNEEALFSALKNKEIAGAGLDVFKDEPISADHPLLAFKNVLALPHIGSATIETRYKMMELVTRNILNVLKGDSPETIVNDELLN
ncbi:2-hydroxyacid dehydrogenase [Pseudalkalibacillus caeni]|uniref:D-glycerate dehydrogenase n=1 Tax=Exobacillus caeni TaxID=2574798 RepID=A0A5R9F7Y6_9BACL|nr:D-glycerate dehydrogenase [Pseudalkalibacillus caeni]TLS38436.1 D-glycerate dehydrogenase [Pseudalkalibacillus caeni]